MRSVCLLSASFVLPLAGCDRPREEGADAAKRQRIQEVSELIDRVESGDAKAANMNVAKVARIQEVSRKIDAIEGGSVDASPN